MGGRLSQEEAQHLSCAQAVPPRGAASARSMAASYGTRAVACVPGRPRGSHHGALARGTGNHSP
eukprot:9590094-Alexandrium_andersonii.AAC.1